MISQLLKDWFFDEFVPSDTEFSRKCGQPIKVLLLKDNDLSHLSESEFVSREIKVLCLPPNVTLLF